MTILTIENLYGMMTVLNGGHHGGRLHWRAANQFEIKIKGKFSPLEYDQARNLALQIIIGANLPAIALKRVMRAQRPSNRASSETKKMF